MKNISDIIHPHMHEHVGGGKDGPRFNANPNDDDNNTMHGIANNPGKSGTQPNDDGVNGFANQLEDVHGGIGIVNKQAAGSIGSSYKGLDELFNSHDHVDCFPATTFSDYDFF
jgi:hypothetical protein